MSLKNERVKSVEQTESALKEQGEAFKAERQALEAEVARFRNEVQKLQVGVKKYFLKVWLLRGGMFGSLDFPPL